MVVVWLQVPSLEKVLEFKAHEGEIEDLALGPDGKVRGWGWEEGGEGERRCLCCLPSEWIP